MQDLVPQVTAGALDQIDLTALVRERLDINAVAQDIDIDALVARVDINAIIDRVGPERGGRPARRQPGRRTARPRGGRRRASTSRASRRRSSTRSTSPEIIRDSSGAMASETVQEVRVLGIGADRFVAKIVDRVLRRKHGRDTVVPGFGEGD